jgi:hypothetical protein
MRAAVTTLAIYCGVSLAFADPPATPAARESQSSATPRSTAEDSTEQNSAARTVPATVAPTPAKSPAVAPANPTPSVSDERMVQRHLRMEGYKLSMVNGQEKYCRREIPLGSHLATVMHCVTVAEAEAMVREGRETTERIQRNTAGCLAAAMGGCGK